MCEYYITTLRCIFHNIVCAVWSGILVFFSEILALSEELDEDARPHSPLRDNHDGPRAISLGQGLGSSGSEFAET